MKTPDVTVYPHQQMWLNSLWRKKVNSIHFYPYHQIKHLWFSVLLSGCLFMHHEDMGFMAQIAASHNKVFRSEESNLLRQNNSPNHSFCIYNVPPSFPTPTFFSCWKMTFAPVLEPGSLWTDIVSQLRLRTPDRKADTSFKKELRLPLKRALAEEPQSQEETSSPCNHKGFMQTS